MTLFDPGVGPEFATVEKGADLSPCGVYRTRLWRRWNTGALLPFVMLNPSTADAEADDPTIRRCVGFARREGWAGIEVVNLFPYRATDPDTLVDVEDLEHFPFGDEAIRQVIAQQADIGPVVAAWGAGYAKVMSARRAKHGQFGRMAIDDRPAVVRSIAARTGARLSCLGVTKDGAPRHPLMVRADQPLIPWRP